MLVPRIKMDYQTKWKGEKIEKQGFYFYFLQFCYLVLNNIKSIFFFSEDKVFLKIVFCCNPARPSRKEKQ